MQPTSHTKVNYTQEVRFAIVMYGGVSLAIYMNGVAQELLRLVRATAPKCEVQGALPQLPHLTDDQLKGSEKVYRKLGQMLVRGKPTLKCVESISETDDCKLADKPPISTRFMIDILSGSSAGGINAIFLAKALANDQDMNQLREMWVKEGDITLLLNDEKSDEGIELGQQTPPRSLLNSRRMYHKLLDALYGMEKGVGPQPGTPDQHISPYADEIDLFTTATDNRGRVINLRLADGVAHERRHLNKFHFRYRSTRANEEEHNDFVADNNPFLAFAARCTSAHQSSFEPMKLADIDESLEKHQGYKNRPTLRSDNVGWRSFYQTYLRRSDTLNAQDDPKLKDSLAEKFKTRPFSDGGALDNSPFTFAIEQLQFRHADLPVERKLMYVEPVPEHPEETTDPQRPPDAIKNAWLALSELPRYQFIREDLERLLERNRLVERVNRIVDGIERDEMVRLRKARTTRHQTKERLTWEDFSNEDIGGMIGRMGSAWGGYHRLRVAETTDEMERILTQAAGFDPESAESQAVRYLVRTWRMQNFDAYGKGTKGTLPDNIRSGSTIDTSRPDDTSAHAKPKETENSFLYKYDIKWRVRRLKFVLKKLDEISCFDDNLEVILGASEQTTALEESSDTTFAADLRLFLAQGTNKDKKNEVEDEFRKELQTLKGKLNSVLLEMVGATRTLIPSSGNGQKSDLLREEDELIKAFDKLKDIKPDRLIAIAERQTDEARIREAANLLQMNAADFDTFLQWLNTKYNAILHKAATRVEGSGQTSVRKHEPHEVETSGSTEKGILEEPTNPPSPLTLEFIARRALRYYYDNFDRYDMITYPLFYATSVGEERDVVDVYRISPEDATRLIRDETPRRRKLAGTSLGNFGAFFDERFRVNDIFWGRLDCAERIITALLPTSPDYLPTKNRLIDEAHRAIIAEEFEMADRAGISALLSTLMVQDQSGEQREKFLEAFDKLLNSDPVVLDKIAGGDSHGIAELQKFIQFSLAKEPKDPLRYFVETYNFDYALNPETLVRTAGRASKIFGRMLEGIAETHRIDKSRVVWVTRLGQLFWSLVEVAVPGSIPNLVLRHWLKLLYLFQFLLIFFSTLLLSPAVQRFGILTFAITVALHTGTLVLGDTMRAEKKWWGRIKSLFVIAAVVATLLGVFFVVSFFLNVGMWERIVWARAWYANDNISVCQRMLYAAPIILISLLFAFCDKLTSMIAKLKNRT
jgi:patatin-related protein